VVEFDNLGGEGFLESNSKPIVSSLGSPEESAKTAQANEQPEFGVSAIASKPVD